MSSPAADAADPLPLVQQGWQHLRGQCPLAAWASWQHALRIAPGDPAAVEALDRLAGSPLLPRAARAVHRFRPPEGDARRRQWDRELRQDAADDVNGALHVFARLATLDPDDAAAWYNLGLCRAWRGENVAALQALHAFVAGTAAADFEAAADAWMLAEILRHGSGAEEHADDLSWTVPIAWDRDGGLPKIWLDAWPHRERPPAPNPGDGPRPLARIFELMNVEAQDPPRVEATLVVSPGGLRFSTLWPGPGRPWSEFLENARDWLGLEDRVIGPTEGHVLPLHLLDSQAWTFRLPEVIDPEERSLRTGEALAQYYEGEWTELPRHGLASGPPSPDAADPPWLAAERAQAGDIAAKARLEGVIRLREQLARRPQAAPLYDDFSFDRLRAHLKLPLRWTDEPEEPIRDHRAD